MRILFIVFLGRMRSVRYFCFGYLTAEKGTANTLTTIVLARSLNKQIFISFSYKNIKRSSET